MNARQEVHRLVTRVDAILARGKRIPEMESQADYARHLCVLASGLIERGAQLALTDYAHRTSSPSILSYVESNLRKFTNANSKKLLDLFGRFDSQWRDSLKLSLADQKKDAIDSIIANRHQIAHGGSVGLSLGRMESYYQHVRELLDDMLNLCGC